MDEPTGTELAHTSSREPTQIEQMFTSIMAAASNPDVDPAKMNALVDLQMRMIVFKREEEFQQAKIAAIMEMPRITKNGAIKNNAGAVQSRYSKFEDIHAVVMPILKRHNLVISFDVGQSGNMVTVTPILAHTNGYSERGGAMPLSIDTTGSKNATQGAGSAASYGKRHTMKAMLNIVEGGEDDDGQAAGGKVAASRYTPEQRQMITTAETNAKGGAQLYGDWFKQLGAAEKGWLVYEGVHERCKMEAVRNGE